MVSKKTSGIVMVWVITMILFVAATAYGQPDKSAEKTLSPYFFVKSEDPELDRLPLKSTLVKANISGVIADVTVTQVYKNEGKKPLEAVYVFPASTRAAVYGMKMKVGEREIVAKIRKREEARKMYEQAKREGKSASLLEQHRPNVFQMSVANILPDDSVNVELRYTELLVPTHGIYEFIYPTVVGPRYSNQTVSEVPPSEHWIENPYLHEGESPTYTFQMAVDLAAGLPIQEMSCSSHQVGIAYSTPSFASVRLDPSEKFGGNRDFILKYRLAGGRIQSGLLLFEGKEENFFLLMLQPPQYVGLSQIPPREYIFVVDVSGSMHGFPLNTSKSLLKNLIRNLRESDRFNVLLFAGGSSVMSGQSLPATPENIRRAINLIDRQRGGGGTELLPALKRAFSLPKIQGYSRSIIIATDGYVSVEEEAFDLIRNGLDNANVFPFGIGSSVNRYLIEGMARVGMGEPFVITKPEEAPGKAKAFRALVRRPVMTGIRIHFDGFHVYDVEPPRVPDVFANRPVIVFGKWKGKPKGTIRVQGMAGKESFVKELEVSGVVPLDTNSALRYLWARHRVAVLSDYNKLKVQDERVQEVTNLGLTYNLLTRYTSFVAIDTQVRLKEGKATTVKQPLPLPQGVSDYAVGKSSPIQKIASSFSPSSSRGSGRYLRKQSIPEKDEERVVSKSSPGAGLKGAKIKIGNITVSEGLSEASVRVRLEKQLPSINQCYRDRIQALSHSKGSIVVKLVINAKGEIGKVIVEKADARKSVIRTCLIQKLKTLRFPTPKGGQQVKVTVAFIIA